MATFSEVINISMTDTRSPNNRVGSVKHNFLIGDVEPANAVFSSSDVTHIAVVSYPLPWTSMSHDFRIPVGTSCRTSLTQVTENMDMKSVQARSKTSHLSGDLDLLSLYLNELTVSIYTRITIFVQHADSIVSLSFYSSLLSLFILLRRH